MKDIEFLGTSLEDLTAFPVEAKKLAGYQLHRVQSGLNPSDWKPMSSVAQGVREIRIKHGTQSRVIYLANDGKKVYVLHAFIKKTQRTPKADIDLAKKRYRSIKR
ncbi:MAG: type II toxin-antitoxin system RelE/ParE family toxin [Pseudomonadales bacterium]